MKSRFPAVASFPPSVNSKPEELSNLAEAVHAKLRSIVRFLLRKEGHEDWPGLLASRPEYADIKHQVDRLVAEFDEIRRTKDSTAAELEAFHDRAAEVDLPKSRIESELSAAWQDEHIALLAKKMTAFATAFEPYRLPLAGTADGKVRQYGAWSAPSACEALLRMAQGIIDSHEHEGRRFDDRGGEWDRLLDDVRCEVGSLARLALGSRAKGGLAEVPGDHPARDSKNRGIQFDPVEQAIVLLMRDGNGRRSMRSYASEVGVNHSVLSRNETWMKAWKAAEPPPSDLPEGLKNEHGNIEASVAEVCENCRLEPILKTVVVNGEAARVCEECAAKLAQRTNPSTTRHT